MNYALNLADDGRILSVTYAKYAPAGAVIVEVMPVGNVADYCFVDGEFVYDPITAAAEKKEASQLDRIEAQITYTAIMTDTLLEV